MLILNADRGMDLQIRTLAPHQPHCRKVGLWGAHTIAQMHSMKRTNLPGDSRHKQVPISRELGTRHRAALGMSENSDAVVLTVSEETGKISIAIDGQLQRNFNYDTLKAKLVKELLPDKSGEGSEKKAGFWKVKSK